MTKRQHRLTTLLRHMFDVVIHVDAGNIVFILLRTLQRIKLTFEQRHGHKMPSPTLHGRQNSLVIAIQPQKMHIWTALAQNITILFF